MKKLLNKLFLILTFIGVSVGLEANVRNISTLSEARVKYQKYKKDYDTCIVTHKASDVDDYFKTFNGGIECNDSGEYFYIPDKSVYDKIRVGSRYKLQYILDKKIEAYEGGAFVIVDVYQ